MRVSSWGSVGLLGAAILSNACSQDDRASAKECAAGAEMEAEASRRMPGPCLTEIDDGVDGVVDRYLVRAFDEADHILSVEYGRVGEDPSWRKEWSYADDGRATMMQVLDPVTRTVLAKEVYAYEGDQLVRVEGRDPMTDELQSVSVRVYDDQGRHVRTDVDRDATGEWHHRYTYSYDGMLVVGSGEDYWDEGWWAIWNREYIYDASASLVEEHYDHRSGSEVHDSVTYYDNDRFGNPLVDEHIDMVDDGRICSYHYYACE